jgi:hypothetical protein
MNLEFNSVEELYQRLKPALESKSLEFKMKGFSISVEDIWNFLSKSKWNLSHNLTISTMVSDIFDVDIKDINEFIKIDWKY